MGQSSCTHNIIMILNQPQSDLPALGDTLQDRVRRVIAANIEGGKYGPGDQLPTERELAVSMGVSLAPVRGALDQLAQSGLVVRRQGKGTFVSHRRVPYRLETWHSCTDDLRNQNIEFSVAVFRCANEATPRHVAELLGIEPEEEAFHLVRMIRVYGGPGIFLESWVKALNGSVFLDGTLFAGGHSLYRQMREQGIHLVCADTSIEICFASEIEAGLFDAPYGTPLLQVTGIASDTAGPREWSRLKYNAAIFSLNMRRLIGGAQ